MSLRVPISVIAFALLTGSASAETTLSSIRFWTQGEVTRVAIELSSEPTIRQDRLEHPDRIFFDFVETRARVHGKSNVNIPVNDPQLKQIRVGQAKPGVARVVLDLTGHPELSTETLPNPTRLIIELRKPGSSPRPAALPALATAPPPATPAITPAAVSPAPPPQSTGRRVATLNSRPAPAAVDPPRITLPPPVLLSASSSSLRSLRFPSYRYPAYVPARTALAKAIPATAPPAAERLPAPAPVRSTPAPPPARTDSAALPATAGGSSLTRALGLKIRRIVIDAGHGGHDPGTHGPTGLTEKEVVLDISLRLAQILEESLGAEVVLTRSDDRFIPLEQRTRIANDSKADLFLSVHANSSPIKSVSGVETYFLSFTTSKASLEMAARENATAEHSVYELKDLLQKIALKDKLDESREFAGRINAALFKSWYNPAANTRNRGVKQAPLVVLIGANMPSVLAEIGFLSNARDERELRKSDVRQKIAEALAKGISQYADSLSHYQVAQRHLD